MKIPSRFIEKFELAAQGMEFGSVSIVLHFQHGKPRVEIDRKESLYLTSEELEELRQDGSPVNGEIR